MDATTRFLVRERARGRCEYCMLPEEVCGISFHVEHVVAKQHLKEEAHSNLALACDRCNFYKGPNISSLDTETGLLVPLFHPRNDNWSEHFRFQGPVVEGRTPKGRATVRLLNMNAPRRIQLRREILRRGESLD